MSLARFNEIWTSGDYPPQPVAEADLREAEKRLGTRLPQDYRHAVLQVGLPRPTIALLDAIVERELDLHSLGNLYTPAEIVEQTVAWRKMGMSNELVAFASDECGNMFCFDADRLNRGSADATAVWFYDHDFDTSDMIAACFDHWIEAFCRVEPWRDPGTT